jgi:carbamoyltransferase
VHILGIHNSGWTTSAALFGDGQLIAACPEERLDRQKYSRAFPLRAIRYCLDEAGISPRDLAHIAVGWNPGINVAARYRGGFSDRLRFAGEWLYSVPNHLFGRLYETEIAHTEQRFSLPCHDLEVQYVTHHDAHAANAFFLSPFDRSAIFTSDAYGERTCTSWKLGEGTRISALQDMQFPQSIGCFYSAITEFLGYDPDGDEWKVMGMAAYGDSARYRPALRQLYRLCAHGRYELDLTYFNHYNFDTDHLYGPKLLQLLGQNRNPDAELEQKHYDLAAAAQETLEEIIFHCLRHLHAATGCPNLCLAGGTVMNSVCNGKIIQNTPFEHVYIPFSPDDTGNSIGAALQTYFGRLDNGIGRSTIDVHDSFWGPQYSNDEIQRTLAKYKLPHDQSADITRCTARLIANGLVVGWFQGRMEFGQRALGNRSILADPRDVTMKDKVNAAVKYREAFRPFAPSVLEERTSEFFEIEPGTTVPYMERVYMIRPEKRQQIPAVTHNDGSGRLQTVSRSFNPRYHELISEFDRLTGVPIVLNTSFNIKGEPIVCSPSDAIRTFFTSGLDVLVLGDFLVTKQ